MSLPTTLIPAIGTYTATLTVDDGNGGTDTYSNTVTVSLTTCNLELHYRTFDNNAGSASDNQIRPHFKIYNNDNASVSLQDITIRYWYTKEGTDGTKLHGLIMRL